MKKLTLAVFLLLLLFPVFAAADAPPVKLLLARGSNSDYSPHLYGYIEVANLGPNKQVTLVYQMDNGAWYEVDAAYHAPTHDNLEAWSFRTPNYTPSTLRPVPVRFAIKYTVNGVTYWDNNGGQDYSMQIGYRAYLESVLFGQATVWRDYGAWAVMYNSSRQITRLTFHGAVFVKNIAYDKLVNIIYSTDNWATIRTAPASYSQTMANGIEKWGMMFDVPVDTANIRYAISYTVNGFTYWDNNFTRNYTLQAPTQ